jgi:hypothetical protein
MGIVEKVKNAKSVEEISTLRNEIATYKYVHPSTISRFNKYAINRRKVLQKSNKKNKK